MERETVLRIMRTYIPIIDPNSRVFMTVIVAEIREKILNEDSIKTIEVVSTS